VITIRLAHAPKQFRLTTEEAEGLHERLPRHDSSGLSAAQKLKDALVSGRPVKWTDEQNSAVLETLYSWLEDGGKDSLGENLMDLRNALRLDLGLDKPDEG
jgi:hypothetical protein